MRYSLLSVIVASTLALTACGNKQADNQAAGASATSSTSTTGATGSDKNVLSLQ
jgi:phosphate transport system substrate-binding protein